jgi:RHS repeat-associated protein
VVSRKTQGILSSPNSALYHNCRYKQRFFLYTHKDARDRVFIAYFNPTIAERQLVDSNEDLTHDFSYDGYGVMFGANPADAATSLLYSRQMYDSSASMYYLRARWYDQQSGRFNRTDPFADRGLSGARRPVIIVAAEFFQDLTHT